MSLRFDKGFDGPFTHRIIKEDRVAVRVAKVMDVSHTWSSSVACAAAGGQSPGHWGSILVFIGGIASLGFDFVCSFLPPLPGHVLQVALFVYEDFSFANHKAALATALPRACCLRPAHIVDRTSLFLFNYVGLDVCCGLRLKFPPAHGNQIILNRTRLHGAILFATRDPSRPFCDWARAVQHAANLTPVGCRFGSRI